MAFVVWMIFFDKNDLFSQYQYHQQVSKLKLERDFYQKETAKVRRDLDELTSNPEMLEKFAREKYLMKKDNEDVFVIVQPKKAEWEDRGRKSEVGSQDSDKFSFQIFWDKFYQSVLRIKYRCAYPGWSIIVFILIFYII